MAKNSQKKNSLAVEPSHLKNIIVKLETKNPQGLNMKIKKMFETTTQKTNSTNQHKP